jgi:ABC-type multidrug transport system ATPase subunit
LQCIIGLQSLNTGTITVFGEKNGSLHNELGYMPQEVQLIERFSIREIVYYFGYLYGMYREEIEERLQYFMKYFMLPDENRMLYKCSSGQQRSVSFIVSVIHNPKLLILDEPTVGLDPVLRQKMWDFLKMTVETTNMTIIITTHYIEEARKADYVGFMREGKLLAEDAPQKIMNNLQVSTLEEAFVQLCLGKRHISRISHDYGRDSTKYKKSESSDEVPQKYSTKSRIKALTYKQAKAVKRLPG